ncbi:MAG: sterol desaturase family protein [Parvularculaceae bacterium]|nr:sterol desaturase family protein [Parvularculaceae bacterium]
MEQAASGLIEHFGGMTKALLISVAVFVPLERLFPIRAGQRVLRAHWRNDLVFYFANSLLIASGLIAIIAVVDVFGRMLIPQSFRAAVAAAPLPLQIVVLLLLNDLGFYAVHRMFHSVPALWRIHAVHHSIEEMDILAGSRVHPIDQTLTKGVSLAPGFLLGFSAEAIAALALLYAVQSRLIHCNHCNVRFGGGFLRGIFVTPEFHHWHHANEAGAYDKNFAGQIALIDRLFGTAKLTNGDYPSVYGVDVPMPQNYVEQFFLPFRKNETAPAPAQVAKSSGSPLARP